MAAAATVAALTMAGVSAGLSGGAAPPAGASGGPGAVSHAWAGPAAGSVGAGGLDAAMGTAPSARPAPGAAAAHRPPHPSVHAGRAPARRPHRQITGQRPARPGRAAPARYPARPRGRAPLRPRPHARLRHQARPRRPAGPAAPYLFYDSVLPTAIPAHGLVATYATGPYAASPAQVAGRGPVLWIDVYGTDYQAMALDIEPSDATPAIAASWVWHRLSTHPNALARLYTSISEWPAVQAAVAPLPAWMRSRIRWWIADPTGVPHLVPGSDATQWYWGSSYDISTASPRF